MPPPWEFISGGAVNCVHSRGNRRRTWRRSSANSSSTRSTPKRNNKSCSTPCSNPKDKPHGEDTARVSIRAYLGSIPDYDDSSKGVKLSGVSEGSPAEKGGLKGGDVVVGFAGKPVATIYDYTNSLAAAKPGDIVEVKVTRDGKDVILKVTLGSRPRGN